MKWIECVECIFYPLSFCKSSRAVIHKDRDEGSAPDPSAWQDAAAYYCHQDLVFSEQIYQYYESESEASVICTEQYRCDEQCSQARGSLALVVFEKVDDIHTEIAEQEGEEDILSRIEYVIAMNKVPRNLGNQCKKQHIQSVLLPVVRMNESFCNEESKYRECGAPNVMQEQLERYDLIAYAEKRFRKVQGASWHKGGNMIRQHCYAG